MKAFLFLLCATAAMTPWGVAAETEEAPTEVEECRLPFNGQWVVVQGGNTLDVNFHMGISAEWYGVDFRLPGGKRKIDLEGEKGFFCFGELVLSPVEGEVVQVVDEFPDNPDGRKDEAHPNGNYVVIKSPTGRFVFLTHLKKDSVKVKTGSHVAAGDPLAQCGNSGDSEYPVIHMRVQDRSAPGSGHGINIIFKGISVVLNGKHFEKVDWPLIRGLVVSND